MPTLLPRWAAGTHTHPQRRLALIFSALPNTQCHWFLRNIPLIQKFIYAFIMLILNSAEKKITLLSWFLLGKANHCHKFGKLKFEDTKYKQCRPYWIRIHCWFWQLTTLGEVMEVEIQITQKHSCGVHFEQLAVCLVWP